MVKKTPDRFSKAGAYHAINAPETTQSILIAEGLATALSAHLIRPEALTVAAIDAGNLLYVARVLRDKFPSAQIIIAADNDHSEGRQNTGRIAAEKAALSVSGWVALPRQITKQTGMITTKNTALNAPQKRSISQCTNHRVMA